jgi:hypothetical protein
MHRVSALLVPLLFGALVLATEVCAAPPPDPEASLVLIKPPLLVVDPSGNASTVITLKSTVDKKTVSLDLSDFSVKRSGGKEYLLGTRRSMTGVTDQDRQVLEGKPLAKDQPLSLKLDVANFWEAGQGTAVLWDGATRVAAIDAVRLQVPFNVQIVSPTPDNPELHLISEFHSRALQNTGVLSLKNSDPITYRVRWNVSCEGRCSSGSGGTLIELPGNSITSIQVSSPTSYGDLFSTWLAAGTIKDEVVPGSLGLKLEFDGSAITQPLPSKQLPLMIRTSFWGSPWQQFWNIGFLCLLLLVGGSCSILAHYGIPNTSRALGLRKRLTAARSRLSQLGPRLDSRSRVILESSCDRVRQGLDQAWWLYPDFATTLDRLTATTTQVEQWIDVASQVSIVLEHAQYAVRDRIPPTLLLWTEQCCEKALAPLEVGSVTPEQLQEMKANVGKAQQWLDKRDQENPDLEKVIAAREARLAPAVPRLKVAYAGSFDGLLAAFLDTAGKPLVPEYYADRDATSIRVDLLNEYEELLMRAFVAAAAAPPAGGSVVPVPPLPAGAETAMSRLLAAGPQLLRYLGAETHESLKQARLFVEQMRQDIFTAALLNELRVAPPRLAIVVDAGAVEVGMPVRFTLRFERSILNQAAATQEWKYVWDFGDGLPREEGWSVHHTFLEPHAGYPVKVYLRNLDGESIPPGSVDLAVPVAASSWAVGSSTGRMGKIGRALGLSSAENRLEFGRLVFALAITVFALLATARQQIQSMTFLEAAGAAIALGFGADTVKNLLTQKPQ